MDAKFKRQLQNKLSPLAFAVCVQGKTEPAYYNEAITEDKNEHTIYRCVCCQQALFKNKNKFISGTGWPSFTQPISNNAVKYFKDYTLIQMRVEVCCANCGAHLGHVFDDGPTAEGKRYCINSVALEVQLNDE